MALFHTLDYSKKYTDAEIADTINEQPDINLVHPKLCMTPLIYACYTNSKPEIIKLLINADADINLHDDKGYTALMYSVINHATIDICKLLVSRQNINTLNRIGRNALHLAIQYRASIDIIQFLLDSGIDVNKLDMQHLTPLMYVKHASPGLIKLLVSYGANVNDMDTNNNTLLTIACGHYEIIDDLATTSDPQTIEQLLECPELDINAANNEGNTALWYLIQAPDTVDMCIKLIRAGADINHQNKNGDTIFHYLYRTEMYGYIKTLLQNCSPNLNIVNNRGETAIGYLDSKISLLWEMKKLSVY